VGILGNTTEEENEANSSVYLNALVVISKGILAAELCSCKILHFFTGDSSWQRLTYIMALKWLLLWINVSFLLIMGCF